MTKLKSAEHSELANYDDSMDFERFISSQAARGVDIVGVKGEVVGAHRDRLRTAVFCSNAGNRETTPTDLRLATAEW